MRKLKNIAILFSFTCFFPGLGAQAESASQSGQSDNPHKWPAYGGTADLTSPEDMGLTAEEIRGLLERLGSLKQQERVRAADEMMRNAIGSEKALKNALWQRNEATNSEMRNAILACRKKMASSKKESSMLRELITLDPGHPEIGKGVSGALAILGILEALNSLNTLAAYKIMIEFSPRHAGVFRREIGRMLVDHGLDALPALVYSRGHENTEIRMFAVKWIRDMKDPLLSEQVQIKNPRRLAQLLEAYAAINELEALDVTLSLTNHNSIFVRSAARKCIERYGKNAKWPVRRLYENTFSREPVDDDKIDEMLKELYTYFDAQRLKPKMTLFNSGMAAQKQGDYPKMEDFYLDVLLDEPVFPKKGEMAAGFLEFGKQLHAENKDKAAKDKFTLAQRLADPGSEVARLAMANLEWLHALELQKAGVVELSIYKSILEKDPSHEEAKRWYKKLTKSDRSFEHYLVKTIMVSFIIFLAAFLIFKRVRS